MVSVLSMKHVITHGIPFSALCLKSVRTDEKIYDFKINLQRNVSECFSHVYIWRKFPDCPRPKTTIRKRSINMDRDEIAMCQTASWMKTTFP